MSGRCSRVREYLDAMEAEIAHWPGVTVRFDHSKKHNVAILAFGGIERKKFFPASPSDKMGPLRCVTTMKHQLRDMGAVRA